jgi:hypothetical protein
MKKIKVKFVGFWDCFDPSKHYFYQLMCKHYDVELSDAPDYIICSCFGAPYEYCKYPQVRIMICGENYLPDLNFIDYAITRYPIKLLDRCFYDFNCLEESDHTVQLTFKKRDYSKETLKSKKYFANFIASHESEHSIRGDFFKELCKYKRVESPGTYLNNMPNGEIVNFKNSSKCDFQRQTKFTLCFESTKHAGFTTEKIVDAFYSDTIPIYYGSDTITDIFNEKAFINVSSFDSFEDAIKRIIEIDQDDELYLSMLREPIFTRHNYVVQMYSDLENFICNIFNQPVESAYRRSRVYWPAKLEKYIVDRPSVMKAVEEVPIKILLKSIFKRIEKRFL